MDLQRLFGDLVRVEIDLWNGVDARLRAELDITLGSFEAMQAIARLEDCRVQDIANELGITVGGVSKIVDRLGAAGLARRRPHPSDGRASIVELTGEGTRLHKAAGVALDEELAARLGPQATTAELTQLAELLARLRSVAVPEQQ